MPELLIVGSADLTPVQQHQGRRASLRSRPKNFKRPLSFTMASASTGMAAAMNGIVAAWRLRAGGRHLPDASPTMPARRDAPGGAVTWSATLVYVMTHDSIGLGEDGPTHQPVEQLWRRCAPSRICASSAPADTIETAECWLLALERRDGPDRAGADAPEPAAVARQHHQRNQSLRDAAPTSSSGAERGKARDLDLRVRLGGRDRHECAQGCWPTKGVAGARRLGALARAASCSSRTMSPQPSHRRRRPGARRASRRRCAGAGTR